MLAKELRPGGAAAAIGGGGGTAVPIPGGVRGFELSSWGRRLFDIF